MHLKSYPKLVTSVQTSSQYSTLFLSQQGGLLKSCGSNQGNSSSGRLPFGVISTNTLHCSGTSALRVKAPSNGSLQFPDQSLGCENNVLRLYQTSSEDADAPLDIWAVIKPGHVREKICIFTSESGLKDGAGSPDRAPPMCTNHTTMTGLPRAAKAKGRWEENCGAKRRRRSGNNQNLQQSQRTVGGQLHMDSTHWLGNERCGGELVRAEDEERPKVSVVEMVAFLEQRANEQQADSSHLLTLQRSSTTITLSRPAPPEARDRSEVEGEELECIRVSDMVAKLETECQRRKTEGDLSRSNSLRRTVGRVLLASRDQSATSCQLSSPSSLSGAPRESLSRPQRQLTETQPVARSPALSRPLSCDLVVESPQVGGTSGPQRDGAVTETLTADTPPPLGEAEPLPGLLFLSLPPARTDPFPPSTDSKPHLPRHRTAFDMEASRLPALVNSSHSYFGGQSKKKRKADRAQSAAGLLGRRCSMSQDFLEMRQRLQQLLEPQPFLALLPHHLLVKVFLLLPTQSLAALKCTCTYFKFIIENYGVRPADSLWVSDPRYRDDPCKQCKKRYGRGDVSLCRWHHKPYCQALPYGPGYWMCCHSAHREAPGCNVGLHDNRWVLAFYGFNMPIYRRSHTPED
ncbi:F-box only protein 34 [Parambassis ranga]|uniref:F-box only protein 34-like n=1 Tax=Parambassis ranga TaxID=210632 RepID=A0A6P7HU34_9TELE|nr:F-box only protein 34-like [Parambassis ranga]XP_028252114.1 F-box only protein 34-like [Parambassis ranga]